MSIAQIALPNLSRPIVIGTLGLLGLAAALSLIGQLSVAFLLLLALLTGLAIVRPILGLYLLALTAPWEEFFYLVFSGRARLLFVLAPNPPWGNIITLTGLRFKPYEPILLGLLIGLVLQSRGGFLQKRIGFSNFRLDRLTWVAVLYVASGLLSIALLPPPSLRSSLNVIVFQFLMVALFVAVRWAAQNLDLIRNVTLFYILVVGNFIGMLALIQFVGYYLGLPIAYFHPEAPGLFRPYATFIEPNPYGNFLAAQAVLALLLAASPIFVHWRKWLVGTASLQIFLLAVNQSRAAWIALIVALVGYALFHFLKYRELKRPVLVLTASLVFFAASIASVSIVNPSRVAIFAASIPNSVPAAATVNTPVPVAPITPAASSAAETLTRRVERTVNPLTDQESSFVWRLRDARRGLQAWLKRPLTGYGPGTWGTLAYGHPARGGMVAPRNIFVAWLVERGLVGLILALAFYGLLALRVTRAFQRTRDELYATLLLAHAIAVVAIFVNFLSSTAEIVPFYWFQIGLLLALTDLAGPVAVSHANRN